jgi:hypothetical protein
VRRRTNGWYAGLVSYRTICIGKAASPHNSNRDVLQRPYRKDEYGGEERPARANLAFVYSLGEDVTCNCLRIASAAVQLWLRPEFWTVALLVRHLARCFRLLVSGSRVQRALYEAGHTGSVPSRISAGATNPIGQRDARIAAAWADPTATMVAEDEGEQQLLLEF